MKSWIGIDPSLTTGIAMWIPEMQLAYVNEFKGTPVEQWQQIAHVYLGERTEQAFGIERLHHFRNANTTRSLLERYGYLRHSLLALGYQVEEVSSESARKWLKVKNKREAFDLLLPCFKGETLTDHQTDALVIALYQAHLAGTELDWLRLEIREEPEYA